MDKTDILELLANNLQYYPELNILPTICHGLINIEVVKRIKARDKLFFNSILPDIYSNIIILGEIDRFLISYIPFCIDGTSCYSTGVILLDSNDDNNLKTKITNNFYGSSNKKGWHRKLESELLPIKALPFSIIIAEAFLQAVERNTTIPKIDIKKVIEKIVYCDSFNKRYGLDNTNTLLEVAKIFLK